MAGNTPSAKRAPTELLCEVITRDRVSRPGARRLRRSRTQTIVPHEQPNAQERKQTSSTDDRAYNNRYFYLSLPCQPQFNPSNPSSQHGKKTDNFCKPVGILPSMAHCQNASSQPTTRSAPMPRTG
jgi:hypothetical protein